METASRLTLGRNGPAPEAAATAAVADIAILGYLRCGIDGTVLAANDTLARWLGIGNAQTLHGRSVSSFLCDESLWPGWQPLRRPVLCRFDLRDGDGRQKPVQAELRPTARGEFEFWLAEDLAGEMIARVAHLEAALTLTSGTVHDVNNVLTVLSGNLFLLTENLRDRPDLIEQARRARNAAERGSTLLRELLTFNRDSESETKSMCPGSHVLALEPLLLRTVRAAGAELEVAVDRDAGSVVAGAAQFESVLINLIINARDALTDAGRIKVRIRNENVAAERARQLKMAAGEYVCLEVTDNGAGIPSDILPRVTESLFSTKPRDHGSGLGLAMVRLFAESCRGGLRIDSVHGRGTRVTLWLPRTMRLAETTANMTLPLSTLPSGDELVLLLSRDRDVRSSLQQILETMGYTVLAAGNMEQANRMLTTSPAPAVVICERSADAMRIESHWLASLRESNEKLRHVALLEAGADIGRTAPDADSYLFRPVSVPNLARTIRNVLEEV